MAQAAPTVSFGGLSALKGVSLELRAGVVHALVGPNGSGKTTLVGVIAGSNLRFEGTVIMRDDDVSRLGPDARVHRGITRTFQLVTLCPTLSVSRRARGGRVAARPSLVSSGRGGPKTNSDEPDRLLPEADRAVSIMAT